VNIKVTQQGKFFYTDINDNKVPATIFVTV